MESGLKLRGERLGTIGSEKYQVSQRIGRFVGGQRQITVMGLQRCCREDQHILPPPGLRVDGQNTVRFQVGGNQVERLFTD